jgi:Domain of Unknown Function (DUF1080)
MRLTSAAMKWKYAIAVSILVPLAGWVAAEGFGVKGGNPMLPGVPYEVHDGTRPQPRIVENAGTVVVKPPADAIVLFDGTNLDAWKDPTWEVKDGAMIAAKKDLVSKESFGAIQLHAEWRVPAGRKVNGQGGGNSGIFIMGLYEIQVLQSNDNKTYPDGQAASLYGQVPPLANATTAQGEWQSYDIIFTPPVYEGEVVKTPAHATVIHNGVVVQNHSAFIGLSTYKKLPVYPATHPETGPVRLQFHGDPIEYRNFWVRPLGKIDQP